MPDRVASLSLASALIIQGLATQSPEPTADKLGMDCPELAERSVPQRPLKAALRLEASVAPNYRLMIGVCALAVIGLSFAVAVLAKFLISSFEVIETKEMRQKTAQILQALDADLRQLHVSNRDYAEWDDSVSYLDTRNPAYISANFTRETLAGMRVDVVWMIDKDGNDVYSTYFDRHKGQVVSPAPRQLLDPLVRFNRSRDFATQGNRKPTQLIVSTVAGPAAVAVQEIKRTDGEAPTGATLIFMRFIADEEMERVRQTSQMPLTMRYLRGPEDRSKLPSAVQSWLASDESADDAFVWASDPTSINAFLLLRNMDGNPIALLSTTAGRDTYALGFRTTAYLLGFILALTVASGALVVWFVLRLRRSFAARYAAEQRYRVIGEQLEEDVVLLDARSLHIIDANKTVLSALECTPEELANHGVQEIFPEIDPDRLAQVARRKRRIVAESRVRRAGGNWVEAEVAVTIAEINGEHVLALVAHDVSHRREAERREREHRRKLMRVTQQDTLTALPNRLFLNRRLPAVMRRLSGSRKLLALIALDLDDFKSINDSRGHPCGDQVLQIIARRLQAAVAAQDVVARTGGDEFIVVASLMPDVVSIEQLAERLQATVAAPVVIGDDPLQVTASIGIAIFPNDGSEADLLLKRAEIAVSHAKSAGKRCFRLFSAEMGQMANEQAGLEQALRQAAARREILMHYQPIVDIPTGRIVSLEALMRWQHPTQGLIAPARFIPIAERTGLIVELGEHALRLVLQQVRNWLDAKVPLVPVAVNVSPLQLERVDFSALVFRLAQEARVELRWLRFEITESAVLQESGRLRETLAALRAKGAQILIDDFGTGYSSLSYLNQLPIDVLKIDRAFIRDLSEEKPASPIVTAVIDMAKRLKLATVAEGIETPEQAAQLLELGCTLGQGYLYSKPVAAAAIRAMLQELRCEAPLTQTVLIRALGQSRSESTAERLLARASAAG
ncbi:MAG: EAL domain-containing protein [Proteobacteria bacterium]|nr:EAL domain-containing protein [Pseudomonadota bacterium]